MREYVVYWRDEGKLIQVLVDAEDAPEACYLVRKDAAAWELKIAQKVPKLAFLRAALKEHWTGSDAPRQLELDLRRVAS